MNACHLLCSTANVFTVHIFSPSRWSACFAFVCKYMYPFIYPFLLSFYHRSSFPGSVLQLFCSSNVFSEMSSTPPSTRAWLSLLTPFWRSSLAGISHPEMKTKKTDHTTTMLFLKTPPNRSNPVFKSHNNHGYCKGTRSHQDIFQSIFPKVHSLASFLVSWWRGDSPTKAHFWNVLKSFPGQTRELG